MSKIWLVHKDGLALGPYEAVELRQQLREGTLDPFDLISRQGSSIRRELVEIDEIFKTENKLTFEQEAQSFGNQSGEYYSLTGEYQNQDATVVRASGFDHEDSQYQVESNGFHPSPVGRNGNNKITAVAGSAQAASPQFHQKVYTRARKNPKKFQIVDTKGKVLGPLSAAEIQSLFYKGVLPSSVVVMKIGTSSRVQIEKFITVYSEAKQKQVKQGGQPQMGMLNSKKMNQMAQAYKIASAIQRHKMIKKMTYAICVLLFIIAGVFGYRTLEERVGPSFFNFGNSKVIKKTKTIKAIKAKKVRKKEVKPNKLPRPSSYKKQSRSSKKSVYKKRIATPKPKPEKRYVPKRRPTSGKLARPKGTPRTVYRPPVTKYVPRASKVPPRQVAKPPRVTVASLRPGVNITSLGPMAFNPDSVRNCEMKCTIRMVGAGGIVNVKFFKIHYGAKLLPKARMVYISGLVQKSGGTTTVLLNGVK